jgi:uncharacterized membrane protein YqjE
MAVPLRDAPSASHSDNGRSGLSIVVHRLIRLVELELELGLTEARSLIKSLVIAAAVAFVGLIVILASLVVLVAGVIAPVFGAEWRHLVISGGVFFVLAAAGAAWSLTKFRKVPWPEETLRSLEETKRWLGAQLRSKLTLR